MTKSTNQKFDLAAAMKGQQWERCKGELRALVAMQGSYHSATLPSHPQSDEMNRFDALRAATESFIEGVEYNGLAE